MGILDLMVHLQPARRLPDGPVEGSDIDGVRGQAGEGKGAKMRQVAHFARAQSHNGNDGMSGVLSGRLEIQTQLS